MASVAEKLGAVANKIREKTGSSELMDLDEMAIAVDELGEKSKQEVIKKLTNLEVTENGDYVPQGDSTGFKKVTVNVVGENTFQEF